MNRRIWPVVLTAALGIAVLLGLGLWQVQRLAEKQALLAELDRRATAEPVDISTALERQAAGETTEFLKVSTTGHYLHDAEQLMIAVFDGNPAWEVVTPLVTSNKTMVLVDRGLVPDELRDRGKRLEGSPQGDVTVTGIIRSHMARRGFFSPENDVEANMWFWWDVPALLASTTIAPDAKPATFVLHLLPVAGDKSFPRPQAAKAGLNNNHLQYAITWFSLAMVLLVIAGLYSRGLLKESGA